MKRKALIASQVFLLFLALALPSPAKAQSTIGEINGDLRALFGGLSKPTPNRRALYDMACHMTDSTLWHTVTSPDTIEADAWYSMYEEYRNSAYDTNLFVRPDTILLRAMKRQKDTVTMNVMAYDYYQFIDTALTTNAYFNFDTVATTLTDKFPRPGYPFTIQKVFAAAPMVQALPYRSITYRYDPDHFFRDVWNNLIHPSENMRVDFGDGTGWHNLGYATGLVHIPVTYAAGGYYTIRTQVYNASGVVKESTARIEVPDELAPPLPDSSFDFADMTVGVWNPCESSGKPLEKIIFYLEGIDPPDDLPWQNRGIRSIYRTQINNTGLASLRSFGYTFLVVDWKKSTRDMKLNAESFRDLLNLFKCKLQDEGSDEQFVVIGESMGGVIARYTLAEMENVPVQGECAQDKLHNTRLFISLDAPHQGANIPLSIQHAYRDFVSTGMFGGAVPVGPSLYSTLVGRALDLFLDSKAAKQLLLYHVDAKESPFMMYSPYAADKARGDFITDLQSVGDFPRFCKTFALSNGSLRGIGQTRWYDSTQRVPNDKLIEVNNDLYVRILKHRVKLYGGKLLLRTNPNGPGELSRVEYGFNVIKVRLKFWGVRVSVTTGSLVNKEHLADTEPFCTAPGGLYDLFSNAPENIMNTVGAAFYLGRDPSYDGAGQFSLGRKLGFKFIEAGTGTSAYSDGLYWNFVPTWSALDYKPTPLAPDIENEAIASKLGKTPFHVIMGFEQANANYRQVNARGAHLFNRWHLSFKNELIAFYDECPGALFSRVINREIGDDIIHVNNRLLPYRGNYGAATFIGLNQLNPLYQHVGTGFAFSGVYSKRQPFNVTPTGFAQFFTRDITLPGHFNDFTPGFPTSRYSLASVTWKPCCDDFAEARQARPSEETAVGTESTTGLLVYPNPAHRQLAPYVRFDAIKDAHSTLRVVDATGRTVSLESFEVVEDVYAFERKLPSNVSALPSGTYIVVITNAGRTLHAKLIL